MNNTISIYIVENGEDIVGDALQVIRDNLHIVKSITFVGPDAAYEQLPFINDAPKPSKAATAIYQKWAIASPEVGKALCYVEEPSSTGNITVQLLNNLALKGSTEYDSLSIYDKCIRHYYTDNVGDREISSIHEIDNAFSNARSKANEHLKRQPLSGDDERNIFIAKDTVNALAIYAAKHRHVLDWSSFIDNLDNLRSGTLCTTPECIQFHRDGA